MFKYNYNPKNLNEFYSNANIITQYNNIDDDDYHNYYHNTALLLAVEIDIYEIKDFESYVINDKVFISNEKAIKYIHNKIRGE